MAASSTQTIEHKRGEILFRRKLAKQHTDGEVQLPDYYGKVEHDKILLGRMAETRKRMTELQGRGVTLSPFIELGAERCQASLVLANDLHASGFAVDISYDQLKTAGHFAGLFQKPVMPHRVCCDVNRLPFKRNSFPFIFCYEFLHHFPSPVPIVRTVYDVLSSGHFFFDDEPVKRPRLILYKQKRKMYSSSYLSTSKAARFLSLFFSEPASDEREHGVLENNDIPLQEWLAAAAIFDERELFASSLEKRIRIPLKDGVNWRNIPNLLLGGSVEGLCKKRGPRAASMPADILDLLTCPECLDSEPTLARTPNQLECPLCHVKYPIKDGIMFLFTRQMLRELYPDFVVA